MAESKDPEVEVEFSDTKSLDDKHSSRKTKIAVFGVLALVLLLGAVVFTISFFVLKKPSPTRLADVNLEEGETLTYQVDQIIELHGAQVQKGTIRAIVGIRVLNKTSEEYWFMMKFNLSHVDGNMDIKSAGMVTEYFLVRLQIDSRSTDLETIESFELYGHRHTDKELIRHIYGILDQLLPTLKRDLYEDVDGVKVTDSHVINPQSSPLLPGAVKMHREANTTDPDSVLIKNHFDRADFLNMPSDIDLDLKYSDFASINKSNGMVTESHAYVSEQLNFGEDIHFKGGVDASMMKITLTSHVSLLETDTFYLGYAESQAVKYQFFVKLVVPKSDPTFSVKEQPHKPPGASKNSEISPNTSLPVHNTTNSSTTALRRSRRASNIIQTIWEEADPIYLRVDHSVTLFEQKVIGINVKGEGTAWIEGSSGIEIGIAFDLVIGGEKVRLFSKTYKAYELEDGQGIQTGFDYGTGLSMSIPVLFLSIGVDFNVNVRGNFELSFPPDGNSLNPVKLAVEIQPYAEATTTFEVYVSAAVIRAGVYLDGTLVRVGLPVTLSYQAVRYPGQKWCVDLSTQFTALEVSAGAFYQWGYWWWGWHWGARHTLYDFGTWAAINRNWQLLSTCG